MNKLNLFAVPMSIVLLPWADNEMVVNKIYLAILEHNLCENQDAKLTKMQKI
jgi:hypothetical protein